MKRFIMLISLVGCSAPDKGAPQPVSSPTPTPTRWDEIQAITDVYCSRCHEGAPHLQSERQFLTARVKGRIQRREMPPPSSTESRNFEEQARAQLLSYFGDK